MVTRFVACQKFGFDRSKSFEIWYFGSEYEIKNVCCHIQNSGEVKKNYCFAMTWSCAR